MRTESNHLILFCSWIEFYVSLSLRHPESEQKLEILHRLAIENPMVISALVKRFFFLSKRDDWETCRLICLDQRHRASSIRYEPELGQ